MNALSQVNAIDQAENLSVTDLINLTEQLKQEGRTPEALNAYRNWLVKGNDPLRYIVLFNFGSLLQNVKDMAAAEDAYRECLSTHPKMPQAIINLGLVLESLGKNEEALEKWASISALALLGTEDITAMQTLALNHMGRLYEQLRLYDLAEQALEQSLKINPKQPPALQHWVHIRQKACKWPVYKPLPDVSKNEMLMATSPLAMLAMTDDPVMQLLCAQSFNIRTYKFEEEFLCKGKKYHHTKIRIGYVSGDLCTHAVGLLLAEFFEAHDREKFEIYAYDYSPEDGTAHRARLVKAFDHFNSINSIDDRTVAQKVLSDEIDVLIDLHGLSSGARPGIFALHPAPLQGTYLGFIGTTAMPWFDFVITDPIALPQELAQFFTERPLYLGSSFIPLKYNTSPVPIASREEYGFTEDQLIMAAFGNVYKITPDLFEIWCNILKRVEKSVLWLIDDNPATTRELKKHAQANGVDANRLVFTPRGTIPQYLSRIKLSDIFLDNFPYNCGSTTSDVISCGVPIITLHGKTMVSRMGISILEAISVKELIASSMEDYEEKTILYLTNNSFKTNIKKKLNGLSSLFHSNEFTLTNSLEDQLIKLLKIIT